MASAESTSSQQDRQDENGRLAAMFERLSEQLRGAGALSQEMDLNAALDAIGPPPPMTPANGGFEGDLEYGGERLILACRNLVVSQIAAMASTQDYKPLLDLFRRGWMRIAFPENGLMPLSCAVAWMSLDSSAGRALVAELARADAKIFASPTRMDTATPQEPLWSAIKHGDESAARAILAALDRVAEQSPEEFHTGHISELLGEAARGNESSPLLHKLAQENPIRWANAGSERFALLFNLWAAGENALAEAILNAAPNKAVHAMNRLDRQGFSPLEAAIFANMEIEPTIAAFDALSRAIDGVASVSLSPLTRGGNPLHFLAQRFPQKFSALAPKLVALGASPRQQNTDGTTPIGLAAERLSWPELQAILGANSADLVASTQMIGRERINGLLAATRSPSATLNLRGNGPSEESSFAANAERIAGILQAANNDPTPIPLVIVIQCAQSTAFRGLAKGFEIMAGEMARRKSPIPPSFFWEYAQCSPVNAAREVGMRDCLSIAIRLGMDINGNAMPPPEAGLADRGSGSASAPEKKSLLYILAESIQYDSEYRRSKNKAIKNERAEHLLELGADPRHPGPGQERITDHPCWLDEFDDPTRDLVQMWISRFEDLELRKILSAAPSLSDNQPNPEKKPRRAL